MKQCISAITPRFSSGRMVAEYMSELYEPAHRLWMDVSRDNFEEARRKRKWETRLCEAWGRVRFIDFGEYPQIV